MALSRKAYPFQVYIDGMPLSNGQVLSVRQNLGKRPDEAVFRVDAAEVQRAQFYLQNGFVYDAPPLDMLKENKLCEIERTDMEEQKRRVHYGRICAVNCEYKKNGEFLTVTSRLDDHLFGTDGIDYDTFYTTYLGGEEHHISFEEVVFNPVVNGMVIKNVRFDAGGEPEYWPETAMPYSDLLDGGLGSGHWNLSDIVRWICTQKNATLAHIKNPELATLADAFDDRDDPSFHMCIDLAVDMTESLPVILDKILTPRGFSWYIDHEADPLDIVIVKRQNPERSLEEHMEPWGQDVHSIGGNTKVKGYNFNYDIVNQSATLIAAICNLKMELTMRLFPAWDMAHDGIRLSELDGVDEDTLDADSEKRRVYRDWVAGELDNYIPKFNLRGIAPGLAKKTLDDALDYVNDQIAGVYAHYAHVASVFEGSLPVSRYHFERCLTLDDDGTPKGSGTGGVVLDFAITDGSEPNEDDWEPLSKKLGESYSASVLKHEIGMRFTADKPINFFRSLTSRYGSDWATQFHMRATGTVDVGRVITAGGSLPGTFLEDKIIRIASGKKYPFSMVTDESKFHDDIVRRGGTLKTREKFDHKVYDYMERLIGAFGSATCAGTMTLEGVDHSWQPLGASLKSFVGRQVMFNTNHPDNDDKYPQVIAIEYLPQAQETKLQLDTYRKAR